MADDPICELAKSHLKHRLGLQPHSKEEQRGSSQRSSGPSPCHPTVPVPQCPVFLSKPKMEPKNSPRLPFSSLELTGLFLILIVYEGGCKNKYFTEINSCQVFIAFFYKVGFLFLLIIL
jgi:hypothetical protein